MELGSLAQRYERLVQGRDFVRRAATLLSAEASLVELFGRLAALLDGFIDASIVQVAIAGEGEPYLAYDFRDGAGAPPADRRVVPDGTIARVLQMGETLRTQTSIVVPIPFGGHIVGALSVGSTTAHAYDDEEQVLLETFALYLGARLHDERQHEESEALTRLVTTDGLTGLANRRGFDEALSGEWRRCGRSQKTLSLAMLDVDFFKRFNDAYGHVAGDTCLRQVARAIAGCVKRPGDVVARYGGEEFALVLPESDVDGLAALAERICEGVAQLAIPHEGSTLGYVTVSIGIATTIPGVEEDPNELVTAADELLYSAKEGGRNGAATASHRSARLQADARVVVRYNLPRYRTPIVGRHAEASAITKLLQASSLVTIAGPGGIGKTRLAVAVALQGVDAQSDGTWFADFAPLTDPELVATTLAAAIGLNLGSSQDPVAAIVTLLKPQHMLLVLDNCEHVIEGAARLADAIGAACPRVRILATSRESFGIDGESVFRLDRLDDDAATELFIARARRADRDLPIDVPTVNDICRRLDGVALAIELAAARARAMPLEQLRARLDERFRLLTGGNRGGAARHQTMLASIGWSYDLLSEQERTVFRRLAVFSGGFTLQAASHIAHDENLESWEVIDALAALTDKSMIGFGGSSERYCMLESIRHYAAERLRESGELEDVRRAHAEFVAALAAEASAMYGHTTQELWLARYELDLDNVRAALDWATAADAALAARITGDLPEFWDYCGLAAEGLRRSEAVLARLEECAGAEIAPVLLAVAHLSSAMRAYRRGLDAGERALAIADGLGDPLLLAKARRTTGAMRYILGDDVERGARDLASALEYFRAHDNPVRTMGALYAYAGSLDPQRGRPLLLEALALANSSGWPRISVAIEMNLAEREFWSGDVEAARERIRRAIALLRSRRSPLDLAIALANLASYGCVAGVLDEAHAAAAEAATIARDHELPYSLAIAMQSLAVVRAARADALTAARLLGYVETSFAQHGYNLERTEERVHERLIVLLRGRLDETALTRETEAGSKLTMQDACALALGERIDSEPVR
jgi:diguanylate cyclase (GGDEF)-like protein